MKNNEDYTVKYVAYNEDGEATIVPAGDMKSLSYLPKPFIAYAIGVYLITYIFVIKCLMSCLTLLYQFLVPGDAVMWETCVYRPLWITLLPALSPIIIVGIALHISKYLTKKLIKSYKESRKKSIILYKLDYPTQFTTCPYCGKEYYKGDTHTCPHCGTLLDRQIK